MPWKIGFSEEKKNNWAKNSTSFIIFCECITYLVAQKYRNTNFLDNKNLGELANLFAKHKGSSDSSMIYDYIKRKICARPTPAGRDLVKKKRDNSM